VLLKDNKEARSLFIYNSRNLIVLLKYNKKKQYSLSTTVEI